MDRHKIKYNLQYQVPGTIIFHGGRWFTLRAQACLTDAAARSSPLQYPISFIQHATITTYNNTLQQTNITKRNIIDTDQLHLYALTHIGNKNEAPAKITLHYHHCCIRSSRYEKHCQCLCSFFLLFYWFKTPHHRLSPKLSIFKK